MEYKIIVDSCGELTDEMKMSGIYETASLSMQVGDAHIIDDETFDQADFLRKVAQSPECPKSSCPSPERYMQGYCCDADHVYAVTLSAELSGSYNSAMLGKNLYQVQIQNKMGIYGEKGSEDMGKTILKVKKDKDSSYGYVVKEITYQK